MTHSSGDSVGCTAVDVSQALVELQQPRPYPQALWIFSGACSGQVWQPALHGDWIPMISVAVVMLIYFAIVGIARCLKA